MYDTGAGVNYISFGDLAALDAATAYSTTFDIILDTTGARGVWGKRNVTSAPNTGWLVYENAGVISLQHGNGSSYAGVAATSALSTGTRYRVAIVWSGTVASFYYNNSAVGTPAFTQAIAANAYPVQTPAAETSQIDCIDGRLGHIMWWNVALTADEVSADYAGVVPRPASLKFWAPGWFDPGLDIISQTAGTKTNTVTIVEDPGLVRAWRGHSPGRIGPPAITLIYKVIAEELDLQEGTLGIIQLYKLANETLNVISGSVPMLTLVKLIAETLNITEAAAYTTAEGLYYAISEYLNIYDGDSLDTRDPDGFIDLTETSGARTTVWRRGFPPFARRTKWQ